MAHAFCNTCTGLGTLNRAKNAKLAPSVIVVAFALQPLCEIIREHWDGQGLWKKFRYLRPARLVSATVDPEKKIPLDINLTNNSKTIKKQRLGVNKLMARLLFWMQFLMDQPEFMNLFTPVCALL